MTKQICDVCGKEEPNFLYFNMLSIKEVECGCDTVKVDMCEQCHQKYETLKHELDKLFMTKHRNNIKIISD